MNTFRKEDDFPLLRVLQAAKTSTADNLTKLFRASSGFENDRLLTFAQQLFLAAHFTPRGVPGVTAKLRDRSQIQLMPIFQYYAGKGDQWSSQALEFNYSPHGLQPDRRREKFWGAVNAVNLTLPNADNLEYALLRQKFPRAQDMLYAGVKPTPKFLTQAIANAYLKSTLWVLQQPGHLGLDLDARDSYGVAANEELLAALPMRTDDPFGWQRGKYLRNTPLILAVKKGWDRGEDGKPVKPCMGDVIKRLLKLGADPNIQDGCGNTALHIAVLQRDVRAIRALLKAGADRTITNNGGLIPADLLKIDYADLAPFLYRQTGHDTNCYIHTQLPEREWLRAGKEVTRLVGAEQVSPRPTQQPSRELV